MKNIITNDNEIKKSDKLFGYNDFFIKFEKLYLSQRLPKVILLSGDKGIGKATFSFHFINYILSKNSRFTYDKEKYSININNDIYKKIILNLEQNFNFLKCEKPNTISIDDIRQLKTKLSKTPLSNSSRFTIIDDIELINLNCANALLKLIEEPTSYYYFFLINNKRNKLIETLISRSLEFKIFFTPEQKNYILDQLKTHLVIENNFTHNYIQYSSPGNLIKFDPIINELKITSMNEFPEISVELLKLFNKTKKNIYISLLLFLIDIKFSELYKKNKNSIHIADIKNKINSLLIRYDTLSLNNVNVSNQFKKYLNYVR